VLAGVLLKLGGYGILKGNIIFFLISLKFKFFIIRISLLGGIYMCLVCIRQRDIKSLIAYSSIVHIGPVLFSFLRIFYMGYLGGIFLLLSHGFCSSGIFFILNEAYRNFNSRSLLILRGCVCFYPVMSFWWFFLSVRNIRCPPTFNFISEILIILGVLNMRKRFMVIFIFYLFFTGVYCIFFYIFFNHGGQIKNIKSILLFSNDFLILFGHRFPLIIFLLFVKIII
jgi:NADH-ubiquinone oxidoreductase chain 4